MIDEEISNDIFLITFLFRTPVIFFNPLRTMAPGTNHEPVVG